MLPSIYQAGQVPAGNGNAREDLEELRRYLAGLTEQLEVILREIDKKLEEKDNGKTT